MVSSEVGRGVDLAAAWCVAFAAVEPRLQKRRNDVYDAFPADHPLAHTQDVRIVVQPGQPGGSDGLTDSRTDTLVLVGDDRHTYSSTADQNAPIGLRCSPLRRRHDPNRGSLSTLPMWAPHPALFRRESEGAL